MLGGSSGSHIVIYVPKVQQRKAQVLAALCILLRYTLLPSGRPTLARSLVRSTQYRGLVGGGPDQPTDHLGGDQGWNSITDSRGGIFIAEVTSIHPPHSPRPGSRELLLRALGLPLLSPSLSFSRHPPARPSFRLCLATSFFFFLHPRDLHLLHRTFSRSPLILPSLSPHNQIISNPGRVTSLSAGLLPCPINPVSTLDPRDLVTPSIKSRCCPPGHANPSDHPSFKNTNQPNPGSPFV